MMITELRKSGFTLELAGDGIDVSGVNKLTDEQRQFIKAHKAEIMQQLREEQAANVPQVIITCFACRHFQSFNKHGRGAGSCAVHEPSNGFCRWHDQSHQCSRFEAKE